MTNIESVIFHRTKLLNHINVLTEQIIVENTIQNVIFYTMKTYLYYDSVMFSYRKQIFWVDMHINILYIMENGNQDKWIICCRIWYKNMSIPVIATSHISSSIGPSFCSM